MDGIYEALGTSAKLIMTQIDDVVIRPSVKIIAVPEKAQRINNSLKFTHYGITIAYYTSKYDDYEEEAYSVMERFCDRLSEEIKTPKGLYIYLDDLEPEIYKGMVVITTGVLIDTVETGDICGCDNEELMEELVVKEETGNEQN